MCTLQSKSFHKHCIIQEIELLILSHGGGNIWLIASAINLHNFPARVRKAYGFSKVSCSQTSSFGCGTSLSKNKPNQIFGEKKQSIIQEGFFGFGKVVDFQEWVFYDMLGINYQGDQRLRPILIPETWITFL